MTEQAAVPFIKLLIIEDDRHLLQGLQDILEVEGVYEILGAYDGPSGLALALEHLPQIIITGMMMPGLSGDQLVHKLKAVETTRDIPVILMSTSTFGHEALFARFMMKPLDPEEFLATVQAVYVEYYG